MIADDILMMAAPRQPMIKAGLLFDHPVCVAAWLAMRVMHGELVDKFTYGVGICPPGALDRIVPNDEAVPLIAAAAFADYYSIKDGRAGWSDITVCAAADEVATLTPQQIAGVLAYPFGGLKCNRVTAYVDGRNHDAVTFMNRFGFICEGAKRGMRDDGGEVLMFGLLKSEAQFNGVKLFPDEGM